MERKKIILLCNVCFSRNYSIFKLRELEKKFQIKKYCSKCNKHTLHIETR